MSSDLWGLREKINGVWHLRTKTNTDAIEKKLDDLVGNNQGNAKMKQPDGTLKFKFSPIDNVLAITIGYDDNFYAIGTDYELRKYNEIIETGEVVETGITWDSEQWGKPVQMFVFSNGISVFSNNPDQTQARIYRMDNMNSTPELIYESNDETPSFFTSEFGIKCYNNGIGSIILAAVYGREKGNRDLLLSLDDGQTFEVVKQTRGNHATNNAHWHDVGIDPYHGFLWASEGDGPENHGIHFSDDLGVTWRTLTNKGQPTAILPFPDKVVFGRDYGKPGLSVFEKPLITEDYDNISDESYKVLREFLPTKSGATYYARTPIIKGHEAYLTFNLYEEHDIHLVMGTGDFGETWHFVHMGNRSDGIDRRRITFMVDMDDEYVYARSHTSVAFAKRLDWV